MKNTNARKQLAALKARLEVLNTELNKFEDGWPRERPTSEPSTLSFHIDNRTPAYAINTVKISSQKLVTTFVGWKFSVHILHWGGFDAGAKIDIFVNGSSFACVRYFSDPSMGLNTTAQCIAACVKDYPTLVENVVKRLETYPRKELKSLRYKKMVAQRRELNQKWEKLTNTFPNSEKYCGDELFRYPYGEHTPGWPVFDGMQLGV